jgi:hypothetical protein
MTAAAIERDWVRDEEGDGLLRLVPKADALPLRSRRPLLRLLLERGVARRDLEGRAMSTSLERVNQLETIRGHTPAETVETALSTTALLGGNARRAAEQLDLPEATVREWRRKYPNRYHAACERFAQEVEGRIVAHQREIVTNASLAVLNALELAPDAKDTKQLAEVAKAAQAFQTTAGIGSDKVLLWTGRPTDIQVHTTVEDILRSRQREYTPYVGPEPDNSPPTGRELASHSGDTNAPGSVGADT